MAITTFATSAGNRSSWNAKGVEILFIAAKRIKASTATFAIAVTVIYSADMITYFIVRWITTYRFNKWLNKARNWHVE